MVKTVSREFRGVERRRYPRIKDNLYVLYLFKSRPNERFNAVTRNIGPDGLMFESEKRIAKGNVLEIEVYHPSNSAKKMFFSIPSRAKVIWTKKIDKDRFEKGENRYKIGLKFSQIKGKDKQRIYKYIKKAGI